MAWSDASAIVCSQTARCEMIDFSLSLSTQPSRNLDHWYNVPLIALCTFSSFPTLSSLQSYKCVPSEGFAWIKFPENWRHKKKRFLIGRIPNDTPLSHRRLEKINWSVKNSLLQARKVRFPTDHLTSRSQKRALRKSRLILAWTCSRKHKTRKS